MWFFGIIAMITFVTMLVFGVLSIFSLKTKDDKGKRNIIVASSSLGICIITFLVSMALYGNHLENEEAVSKMNEEQTAVSNKLDKEIEDKQTEYTQKELEVNELNTKIEENQKEFEAALAIVEDKEATEKELEKLDGQIKEKKSEVDKINDDIKKKKDELAAITGQIKEKKDAPVTLSAGNFTVGKDIPEGRYKAVPNGGAGNFFVNDGADVNIMIGKGEFYESEYVFDAYEGDEIEITTSVKFIPVE
ncbi:hypothetical protein [Peribacillus butanolivorans]